MQEWQSLPHTQQRSEANGQYPGHHKEQQNLSGSWFILVQADLTAQPTCSSCSGGSGSYIHHSMACGPPYISLEGNKRIQKEPLNCLILGLIIATQSPSIARTT